MLPSAVGNIYTNVLFYYIDVDYRVLCLGRLKSYLWDTDAVATYKETRNGLLGKISLK